jgi:hypothetical protein
MNKQSNFLDTILNGIPDANQKDFIETYTRIMTEAKFMDDEGVDAQIFSYASLCLSIDYLWDIAPSSNEALKILLVVLHAKLDEKINIDNFTNH